MHGNVSEWTLDYPVKDRTSLPDCDVHGAPNANGALDLMGNSVNTRVVRGGSWKSEAIKCRSAFREGVATQTGGGDDRGVRLVINVK